VDEFGERDQITGSIVDGSHRRCLRGFQVEVVHRGRQLGLLRYFTVSGMLPRNYPAWGPRYLIRRAP
jgi:hypothetical protein